jgi:NAD(P)-dependent dehydrogenase (short-subunit alcohol dehydrogenase family)
VNDYGGVSSGRNAGRAGTVEKAQAVVDEITAAGGTAVANGASVASYNQVADMVASTIAQFGRLDIVIANAGVYRDRPIEKLEESDFDTTFDVNVKGSFNMVRHAWPHMVKQGYGRIVLTTSGSVFGARNYWLYGSAKAAIIGMVNNLRHEGKAHSIKVNAILPGAATAMTMSDPTMTAKQRSAMESRASPGLASPAAVFLSHEHCQDSGEVVFAEMGRFGRLALLKGPAVTVKGIDKGAETEKGTGTQNEVTGSGAPLSAEWVREHWDQILGLQRDGQKAAAAAGWQEMDGGRNGLERAAAEGGGGQKKKPALPFGRL